MTVACRVIGCPQNSSGFCCAETILINRNGNCFDLIRGFSPVNELPIRKESSNKIMFTDALVEQTDDISDDMYVDQEDYENMIIDENKTDEGGE